MSCTKENSRRTFEDLLATEPKKNIEEMLSRGVSVLEDKETMKNLLDGTNSKGGYQESVLAQQGLEKFCGGKAIQSY